MGYFDKLTAEEQVSYLIKPILEVLSQASTPLKTSEIRSLIIQLDTKIAEFANTEYTSKQTGNTYNKFTIKFGLALKELIVLDIVERQIEDKTLVLTSKGRSLNLELLDVQKEIRDKAQVHWKKRRKDGFWKRQKKNFLPMIMTKCPLIGLFKKVIFPEGLFIPTSWIRMIYWCTSSRRKRIRRCGISWKSCSEIEGIFFKVFRNGSSKS